MSEENKDNINEKDLEALNNDIEDAKAKLVSKETEEKLAAAKEEAKKEAAKEFETNQRIKELEAELKKKEEAIVAKESESAEKISLLTDKVNNYIESKANVGSNNPFKGDSAEKNIEQMPEDDVEKIEHDSFNAFINERIRKD